MSNPSSRNLIPFLKFGGQGQIIHFAHANGYPPGCYRPLFSNLQRRFEIISMFQKPLWENSRSNDIYDWHPLSEDLIDFLDQESIYSVVAVGHSMGGIVSLRASINNPNRFKALILIDPVLFSPRIIFLWKLLHLTHLAYHFHPFIKATSRRRIEFPSIENAFENYRGKKIFHYMDDSNLLAYIEGLTKPSSNGGIVLIYDPKWEMKIYATGIWNDKDIWKGISSLEIPVLFIRGSYSNTFLPSAINEIKKKLPSAKIITIVNSTHLVPLEQPELVSSIIEKFIEERL